MSALSRRLCELRAAALIVRASLRIARRLRSSDFVELTSSLRDAPPLETPLRDPELLGSVVERLLPYLPPRHAGPCAKRALLLLHLWSRCGIDTVLHIGYRPGRSERGDAHMWVTAPGRSRTDGDRNGFVEVARF